MLPYFTHFVALGDSVAIDLYPALDAGEIDVAVALERDPAAGNVAPLGAASLLYQNDDARWPEDQSDDLVSRYVGITMQNLAADGATIGDVFGEQLSQLEPNEDNTLVTLSVGGEMKAMPLNWKTAPDFAAPALDSMDYMREWTKAFRKIYREAGRAPSSPPCRPASGGSPRTW